MRLCGEAGIGVGGEMGLFHSPISWEKEAAEGGGVVLRRHGTRIYYELKMKKKIFTYEA